MWRVCNQYMPTWWGPVDFLEQPVSPITGTNFENAAVHKMVHISEFTADLIHHGKLNLDPQRNAHIKLTFHDSCNTARGMGILEEPRYIINNVLARGQFRGNAPQHHPGEGLLLRQLQRHQRQREHGTPHAGRLPPGQRGAVCRTKSTG